MAGSTWVEGICAHRPLKADYLSANDRGEMDILAIGAGDLDHQFIVVRHETEQRCPGNLLADAHDELVFIDHLAQRGRLF
jgi:hypothetical protein